MARPNPHSGQFKKGHGGRPKGALAKTTLDQREMFDEAVPRKDRIMLIRSVVERALRCSDKEAAPYLKLCWEFLFSRPNIGHVVSVMDIEEVMSPEVCSGVWEAIQLEAREREKHAQSQRQPVLGIIDAEVVATKKKVNGRRNGPARNGPKKKTDNKKTRKD